MFKKYSFCKRQKGFLNAFSKYYTEFIYEYRYKLVVCYLIIFVSVSLGILQLKYDENNELLTLVTNGEGQANLRKINQSFHFDQYGEYYQHQLIDLGHYVEIILVLKDNVSGRGTRNSDADLLKPEYSFMNQTYLDQYNYLFDRILNLTIEVDASEIELTAPSSSYSSIKIVELEPNGTKTVVQAGDELGAESAGNKTRFTLRLRTDLCTIRAERCAIEGSLLRAPTFQKKFLEHKVDYDSEDPKTVHLDTEIMDGSSLDFLFGKYRIDKCEPDSGNPKRCGKFNQVHHVGIIRNRFDLRSRTEKESKLSIKFMKKFVELMDDLTSKTADHEQIKDLNISYHTSHTLQEEIEKYSLLELHFVFQGFALYWLIYLVFISFNMKFTYFFKLFKLVADLICSELNSCLGRKASSNSKNASQTQNKKRLLATAFSTFKKRCIDHLSFSLVNGSFYLAIAQFVQYCITLLSTFGFMGFLGVPANKTLFTILFLLLINSTNQSILLYNNLLLNYQSYYSNMLKSRWRSFRNIKLQSSMRTSISNHRLSFQNGSRHLRVDSKGRQIECDEPDHHHCDEGEGKKVLTKQNLLKCYMITIQEIFLPNIAVFLATLIVYIVISVTSCYRVIEIYAYYTIVCVVINFLGLLLFYCPCLLINIVKMNEGRNCFLFCYRHEHSRIHNRLSSKFDKKQQQVNSETREVHAGNLNEKSSARIISEQQELEEAELRINVQDVSDKQDEKIKENNAQLQVTSMSTLTSSPSMSPSSSSGSSLPSLTTRSEYKQINDEPEHARIDIKRSSDDENNDNSNATLKLRDSQSPESNGGNHVGRYGSNQPDLELSKKKSYKPAGLFGCLFANSFLVTYSIFALFILYGFFNLLVIFKDTRANIPLVDLIPKDSYLNKHMRNHLDLFSIGPLIMVGFVKPINYWDQKVHDQIYGFLNEAKLLKGMNPRFHMSWLDELESRFNNFPDGCEALYTKDCFCRAFESWASGEIVIYGQDLVFKPVNCSQDELEISSSRFYLQFKEFNGVLAEYNLVKSLKQLAEEKYNLTSDKLVIYSVVDLYLEQIGELLPSLLSMVMLTLESVYLISLIFLFDIRTTLLLTLVSSSFFVSVLSCMTLLRITFNIITLINYLMLPAFIIEFFFHISYLFVVAKSSNERIDESRPIKRSSKRNQKLQGDDDQQVPTHNQEIDNTREVPKVATPNQDARQPQQSVDISSASSTTSVVSPYIILAVRDEEKGLINQSSPASNNQNTLLSSQTKEPNYCSKKQQLKQLNYCFQKTSNMMVRYLAITLISFLICMSPCQTYTFHNLNLFLLSTLVNIILHLLIFFPNLLRIFGASKSKRAASLPCKLPK